MRHKQGEKQNPRVDLPFLQPDICFYIITKHPRRVIILLSLHHHHLLERLVQYLKGRLLLPLKSMAEVPLISVRGGYDPDSVNINDRGVFVQ